MNVQPTGEAKINSGDRRIAELRQMTVEQFLYLGMRQVVYLKAGMCDGEMLFVLYAADGTPLVTADDAETAVEMAAERGLQFIAVH